MLSTKQPLSGSLLARKQHPGGLSDCLIDFVPYSAKGYIHSLDRCRQSGVNRVLLHPLNSVAVGVVAEALKRGWGSLRFFYDAIEPSLIPPAGVQPNNGEDVDVRLLFIPDAEKLSSVLSAYFDQPCRIIAPITEHYYKRRSIFVITIPKSGTHLLFQLLSDFDILTGDFSTGELAPQHWYCAISRNTHTDAYSFLHELSHHKNEGYSHPLFSSAILFMYRNPLDIVVSEMNHCRRIDRSALAHFVRHLSPDDLLLKMIEHRGLAGGSPFIKTIRDSIALYTPWLSLPNVIPLSFEELVGTKGGGSYDEQIRTIWSLQLKLHIPGRPEHYGALIFDELSKTFHEGKINSHRRAFRPEHWQAFKALPQDFMHDLGYDINDEFNDGYVPRFVGDFRRRLVAFPRAEPDSDGFLPHEVIGDQLYTYKGYFVANVRRRFWAVPQGSDPVDLRRDAEILGLYTASSFDKLKSILDRDPLSDGELCETISATPLSNVFQVDPPPPELFFEDYKGFNIVQFDGNYFAIPQNLGPVDLQWDDVTTLKGIVAAESIEGLRQFIDDQSADVEG